MTLQAHWYVVHAYSGFENKVRETILEQAAKKGLEAEIEEILVPIEEYVEVKKGEKITLQRCYYPGYVLVKMQLSDQVWHMIKDIPKVAGFLGERGRPIPVPQSEVDKILRQVQEGVKTKGAGIVFEIGEKVRVCEGPFASFTGLVEEVEQERSRLKVSVSIFGRATPVELEYTQVEKV